MEDSGEPQQRLLHSANDEKSKFVMGTDSKDLYYGVEDVPSIFTTILFGFQQVMVCASGVINLPLVVATFICLGVNDVARVELVGTMMVVTGLSTILQSTIGTRLPLVQGPSAGFIAPIVSVLSLPEFKCTMQLSLNSSAANKSFMSNESSALYFNASKHNDFDWRDRICMVQGGILAASAVQMLIGATGVIGLLTKFIGPLTIAPLMLCLEMSLVGLIMQLMKDHWISIVLVILLLISALYMTKVNVPVPVFSLSRKFHILWVPLFALFPYIFAISVVWMLCWIFTESNVFTRTTDESVRTDRLNIISKAPWIRFPYPGQYGPYQFNVAMFVGLLAGIICSVLESVGDYHACARITSSPRPPSHAVNRGILVEGLCCFIGGLLGGVVPVTTYSENVGVIGITKVASRVTMQAAGAILILFGLFTKVGAVFATLPEPMIGGILALSLAMVGGVGLSSVQIIDLHLSRNKAILGISIMFGLLIPRVVRETPIKTGAKEIDQLLFVLLTTDMIVGGMIGFILDNTVPGATKTQRGLGTDDHQDNNTTTTVQPVDIYSFPKPVMKILTKLPGYRYIPFLPPAILSVRDILSGVQLELK